MKALEYYFHMKAKILAYCPPPWDQGGGGNDFCVISQAGGAIAKLQEPGWGHIQGGNDFRQSNRGGTALS